MQDIVHTETDAQGIQYRLLIEANDLPVEGNVSARGDTVMTRAIENNIRARRNSGDLWAWCLVECQAVFHEITGSDYLGACCYADTNAFIRPGGHWEYMKADAKIDLLSTLAGAKVTLEELEV